MKISWIAALAGLVIASVASAAGVTAYKTDFGMMQVHNLGGSKFYATYPTKNGRLIGHFSGRTFQGQWVQNRSGKKCKKEVNGSRYWGRAIFVFSKNFRNFSGQWSHCGKQPNRKWNGSFVGGQLPGMLARPGPGPKTGPVGKCAKFPLGCGPGYTDLRLRGIDCQRRTQVGCLCWKGLESKAVCNAYRAQKRR
ncbi:MAG: hypothetical protein LJE84_04175 [Gammaproteobacteria bacterium]|nr:hypothetical protein [Gammaproteobacteria bacterium]